MFAAAGWNVTDDTDSPARDESASEQQSWMQADNAYDDSGRYGHAWTHVLADAWWNAAVNGPGENSGCCFRVSLI